MTKQLNYGRKTLFISSVLTVLAAGSEGYIIVFSNYVQGYVWGRPMEPEDAKALLG
ncbi:MAG: hypothetical protein IKH20_07325 [Clostridiales bacterium]|nr:hypothetical protein [Clostridiales bacterium]